MGRIFKRPWDNANEAGITNFVHLTFAYENNIQSKLRDSGWRDG